MKMIIKKASSSILLLVLFTLFLQGETVAAAAAQEGPYSTYKCYEGLENRYSENYCAECIYNVNCMCAKILTGPSFNSNDDREAGVVRRCWANPHNALRPGCSVNFYQGQQARICLCDGQLCNSAPGNLNGYTYLAMISAMSTFVLSYLIKH